MIRASLVMYWLGISDTPEWCEDCLLPSRFRGHVGFGPSESVPTHLSSYTFCTECGRQGK